MRRQASLLLAHGHPEAYDYTIGMIWEEAQLVTDRLNRQLASEMILLQMAVSSVMSTKAGKEFQKQITRLTGHEQGR